MALRLIIGACSNEHVASLPRSCLPSKPPGRFVAEIVRDFERTSHFPARANAARSIRRSDQPLLAGLDDLRHAPAVIRAWDWASDVARKGVSRCSDNAILTAA
jgi:hypothetical protein